MSESQNRGGRLARNDPPSRGTEWDALRERVLSRDGHACRFCDTTSEEHQEKQGQGLHAHHILPRNDGGEDTLNNLITLCSSCHATLEHAHAKEISEELEELRQERDSAEARADDLRRQLQQANARNDDLEEIVEELRQERDSAEARTDDFGEIVKYDQNVENDEYGEHECSFLERREQRRRRRMKAGLLTRAKWWITGMPAGDY